MKPRALLLLVLAVALRAAPEITVTPDRADWSYGLGDPVTFTVRVLDDGNPVDGARIDYRLGPERFETPFHDVAVPPEGLVIAGGTMAEPGFLRCLATMGETRGLATVGFAPEKIVATQTEPEDFDAFWAGYLARLAKVPVNLTKTLQPDASTADMNVYHVSFDSWNFGDRAMRFYGVLTEPKAPGSYPAVLRVPGAGVRPYTGEKDITARGIIALQIGIHGIPIDLPQPLYDNLRNGALNYYPGFNLDDRDQYYFLRVYLACVRANDVLVNEAQWDGKTLVVVGGSQGGQLSITTSALDPRVTGTVTNFPAYADTTGYLHDRAGGWPHLLAQEKHRTDAKLLTASTYDVVNFARRLRAPISMAFGYNDETCPPTSMQAVYNLITVEKSLHLELPMGHRSSDPFYHTFLERIAAMAGVAH